MSSRARGGVPPAFIVHDLERGSPSQGAWTPADAAAEVSRRVKDAAGAMTSADGTVLVIAEEGDWVVVKCRDRGERELPHALQKVYGGRVIPPNPARNDPSFVGDPHRHISWVREDDPEWD